MEQDVKTRNIPTVFIIFGATGDLMQRKIVPALFHLFQKEKLPRLLRIIGFSRRDLKSAQFVEFVKEIVLKHLPDLNDHELEAFLKLFSYQRGNFEYIDDYKTLATMLGNIDGQWRVCSNKLFYLAVPPQYYKTMFEHLKDSGLTIPCGPDEGWTRVLVEKPFGKDLRTAEMLDSLLGKLFREEQIFRIDHYVAKEALRNILSFRFANNLFEDVWNKEHIEKIEVRLLEDIGVERRGEFYDGVGALRDVGQNHLLQMLSLVTMKQPSSFEADEVRSKRAEILQSLKIPTKEEILKYTLRAQYKGYRQEKGVSPSSTTETYFKVRAYLVSPQWEGVPIILESGKALSKEKEIVVIFKHVTPCLCPPGKHYRNKIIFSIEPKEKIIIQFWAKKPGLTFEMEQQTFNFLYKKERRRDQYAEEYEKLLLDCITGNQLLFISTDEIQATWKFIDAILQGWQDNLVQLHSYKPQTKTVFKEASLVELVQAESSALKREVGIIGLGKMGGNMARRLFSSGWHVVGFNRTKEDTEQFISEGGDGAYTLDEFIQKLSRPRVVLLSLTAGKPTENMIDTLLPLLEEGDYIVDGGNGHYKNSVILVKKADSRNIHYVDLGISGGPSGAKYGACLMVGGRKEAFEFLKPLFQDMAAENGVQFFPGAGAGHFVKMVHNGIEYGMMQVIAEGFTILKNSNYKLDLTRVADVYNHGSVIESRLIGWLKDALELYGEDLKEISGSVAHTGEGEWTVKTAKELKVRAKVIEEALKFRLESEKNPSYTGKILSALRNMFGGHNVKEKP